MAKRKVYWDTSCFISLISGDEDSEWQRALICQDVLKHAKAETIELWTSVWSIAETVRPKERLKTFPLPPWAALLSRADTKGVVPFPNAASGFENICNFLEAEHHAVPPPNGRSGEQDQRDVRLALDQEDFRFSLT